MAITYADISYDVVALVLVAILLLVYQGKKGGLVHAYNVCFWIMDMVVLTCITHIGLYFSIIAKGSKILIYALAVLNPVCIIIMMAFFNAFIVYLIGEDFLVDFRHHLYVLAPCAIVAGLYALSPWFGFMFTFDKKYNMISGPFRPVTYILVLYLSLCWMLVMLLYRKVTDKKTKLYIHILVFNMVLAGALSYTFHRSDVVPFATVLVVMLVLYSLKSPEDVYDSSNAMHKSYLVENAALEYSRGRQFATIFLTLHDLDIMNDSFGEIDVNSTLRSINQFITGIKRGIRVYRLDNLTFAIFLQYRKKDKVIKVRESIMDRFLDEWRVDDVPVRIPISMATLYAPDDAEGIDDYKGMLRFFTANKLEIGQNVEAAIYKREDKEAEILEAVRVATKEHNFEVYYQPIYSTKDKSIVAAEALIRLKDPKLGFISPEIFIPLAEREGYILEIGRFVFVQVCDFISKYRLAEKGIKYIEVNLSAIQCMQYELADEFMNIMKQYEIHPNQINFEITETSAMTTNAAVSLNINSFVDNGIDLSLDDYGTGYSNISYLYHLPFSIIKIDKSILWSADKNAKANITLANIFNMAKKLDMHIVVEGVETEEQIKKLISLKCDYFQGYYFSKPIPGEAFVKYIDEFVLPEVCM